MDFGCRLVRVVRGGGGLYRGGGREGARSSLKYLSFERGLGLPPRASTSIKARAPWPLHSQHLDHTPPYTPTPPVVPPNHPPFSTMAPTTADKVRCCCCSMQGRFSLSLSLSLPPPSLLWRAQRRFALITRAHTTALACLFDLFLLLARAQRCTITKSSRCREGAFTCRYTVLTSREPRACCVLVGSRAAPTCALWCVPAATLTRADTNARAALLQQQQPHGDERAHAN